ncbi:sugar ABC transporter substrate-binding protein [Butyricicoccus sp.]|uniref:sugar ABC transporter substrate-binding protein n=1 Tax=Butyricicoccus sp. TaxID=2049021 RepID=UPI003AADF9B8
MKKVLALVIALMLAISCVAVAEVDYTNLKEFVIDPAQIPQEKLDTTLYVAVSVRDLTNPYIATIAEGMNMFCEYLDSIGQKYETQILDSGGDSNVEVQNMASFAAKAGGNAIAYADPNENTIAWSLAEAMGESGGYIGTAWNKEDDVSPMDLDNWVCHTSPDNVIGGYNTAKALFDAIGGKGQVFCIEGMLTNTASIDRVKGFYQAVEEYPDIEVVLDDTANWNTTEALTLVETNLTKYPDVAGIWCANDNMATGTLQALDAAGKRGQVGVVGFDANTDIVEAIAAGNATATISSNGYLQGGYTLALCYAVWTGLLDVTEIPEDYRIFATPSQTITAENVEEYISAAPEYDFSHVYFFKAA